MVQGKAVWMVRFAPTQRKISRITWEKQGTPASVTSRWSRRCSPACAKWVAWKVRRYETSCRWPTVTFLNAGAAFLTLTSILCCVQPLWFVWLCWIVWRGIRWTRPTMSSKTTSNVLRFWSALTSRRNYRAALKSIVSYMQTYNVFQITSNSFNNLWIPGHLPVNNGNICNKMLIFILYDMICDTKATACSITYLWGLNCVVVILSPLWYHSNLSDMFPVWWILVKIVAQL